MAIAPRKDPQYQFIQDAACPCPDFRDDLDPAGFEEQLEQARQDGRQEAFHALMDMVFVSTKCGDIHEHMKRALRELVVVGYLTRPEIFSSACLQTLAEPLGVSRQALSKRVIRLTDELKVHFRPQKRESSREVYRKLNTGDRHWRRKRAAADS